MKPDRPWFFEPWRIRLPLPGWVSILHRASGLLLFLALPGALYLLQTSLATAEGYARVAAWLASPAAQVLGLFLLWAALHHLLAGLRHLFLDSGIGLSLPTARRSAAAVLLIAVGLTLGLFVMAGEG